MLEAVLKIALETVLKIALETALEAVFIIVFTKARFKQFIIAQFFSICKKILAPAAIFTQNSQKKCTKNLSKKVVFFAKKGLTQRKRCAIMYRLSGYPT